MRKNLKNVTKNKNNKGGITVRAKLKNATKSMVKILKKISEVSGFVPKIVNKYVKGKEGGNLFQQSLFHISEIKTNIQTWVLWTLIGKFLFDMFTSGNIEFMAMFKLIFELL